MEFFRLFTAFLALVLKVLPHQRDESQDDSAATNHILCSLNDREFVHFTDLLQAAPVAASENACAALCGSMDTCNAATYEWSTKRCHPSAVAPQQSATASRDGITILIPLGSALSCGALFEEDALAAMDPTAGCAPESNSGCGEDEVCLPESEMHPASCIPRCYTDADCTSKRLRYWFQPANPYGHGVCMASGICQQCNTSEDCPKVAPFCAAPQSPPMPWIGGSPYLNATEQYNRCLECLDDTHCQEGASCLEDRCMECGGPDERNQCDEKSDRRLCDYRTLTCYQCEADEDCEGNADGPVCDYLNKRCGTNIGGCTDDAYCLYSSAKFCAPGTAAETRPGVCTECRPGVHEDCAHNRAGPFCADTGRCELCLRDGSGCEGDKVCYRQDMYGGGILVDCIEPCTSDEYCRATEGAAYLGPARNWTCLESGHCSECSSADHCDAGQECQLSSGHCRPAGKGCVDDSGCLDPDRPKCRRGHGCIELGCDYTTGTGCSYSDDTLWHDTLDAVSGGAGYESAGYEDALYGGAEYRDQFEDAPYETSYHVYADGYAGVDYTYDSYGEREAWSGRDQAYDEDLADYAYDLSDYVGEGRSGGDHAYDYNYDKPAYADAGSSGSGYVPLGNSPLGYTAVEEDSQE